MESPNESTQLVRQVPGASSQVGIIQQKYAIHAIFAIFYFITHETITHTPESHNVSHLFHAVRLLSIECVYPFITVYQWFSLQRV